MSSPVLLQLTFTTGTLTVLNVRAVTLSDEDFGTGNPYRLTANGIVASRSALTGIRIPTEADLDEQNIPRDIQFGWRKSAAPVQELPMRLA